MPAGVTENLFAQETTTRANKFLVALYILPRDCYRLPIQLIKANL